MSIEWTLVEMSAVREPSTYSLLSGGTCYRWQRMTWEVRVEHGTMGREWWRVYAVVREVPAATVGLDAELHKALGLARARARQLEEVLGGSIRDGKLFVDRVLDAP